MKQTKRYKVLKCLDYMEIMKILTQKIYKTFFNNRAKNEMDDDLSVVLTSEERHQEHKNVFQKNIDVTGKKVLEIGCGIGRWAKTLHNIADTYLGIDYTENVIKIAKNTNKFENCFFQIMSATDIKIEELLVKPPFDVIIITGVLLYINDKNLMKIMESINKVTSNNKKIFIAEPNSCLETRLTLKDFYSEELESDYNAIYRAENEYLEIFKKLNHTSISVEDLYQDINQHTEPKYKFFIIE